MVGAGPGDPGLLTLRAAELLREADVVLYDALVSPQIVEMLPPSCEKIFVGKRSGAHATPQAEIEAALVREARAGKRVVRLKGGDPFVFGRGGEEAEALQAAGIPFAVVPGVTSAIAAPAYAGIPVTHRQFNTAFTVLTGHADPGKALSTIDWKLAAHAHQTLIMLMALGNLREIALRLIDEGLPATHPAAVIVNGTLPTQQTIVGTLATIADLAQNVPEGPAIVIAGDAVALRDRLAWFERSPLFGKRILVMRPFEQSGAFVHALLLAGAEPIVAPVIRIVPPADAVAAEWATREPGAYAWVVFTSVNGVRAFFEHLDARRDDLRNFGSAKIAAIGIATSAALRERGGYADLVPLRYVAEELAEALVIASRPGDRFLLYRAEDARDVLPDRLASAGRHVDAVAGYRTEFVDDPRFAEKVERADVLTFTSSSTVRGFVHLLGGASAAERAAAGKIVACIGPVTAQTAQDSGLRADIVADEFTVDGLMAALERETVAG